MISRRMATFSICLNALLIGMFLALALDSCLRQEPPKKDQIYEGTGTCWDAEDPLLVPLIEGPLAVMPGDKEMIFWVNLEDLNRVLGCRFTWEGMIFLKDR